MNIKNHFGVKLVISHKKQLTKLQLIKHDYRKNKNTALKISEKEQFLETSQKKTLQIMGDKKKQKGMIHVNGEYLSPIKRSKLLLADDGSRKQKYHLNQLQRNNISIKYQVINHNTNIIENNDTLQKKSSFSSRRGKSNKEKNRQGKRSNEFLSLQGKKVGCKVLQGFREQKKIKALFNTLMSRQLSYNSTSNSKISTPNSFSSQRMHKRIQSSVQFKKKESKQIKPMNFSPQKYYQQEYQRRLKYFKDFLFRILFFHRIGKSLSMKSGTIHKYKVHIRTSSNYNQLVKDIFKKRFWYQIVDQHQASHIIWSDKHEKSAFNRQKAIKINKKYDQQLFEIQNQKKDDDDEQRQYKQINKKLMPEEDAEAIQRILKINGHKMIYPQYQCSFVTNHIPNSQILTDKRLLLKNLKEYFIEVLERDFFQIIPKTVFMPTFQPSDFQYLKHILGQDRKKIWLCKAGQGFRDADGIDFLPTKDVIRTIKQRVHLSDIPNCTYIVQQYLINPFLYQKRKIDICHYIMITIIGGALKVFWYPQGYFRTSNMPFNMKSKDKQIHFLGEGVQKEGPLFGKYQDQNKISYYDFQRYLDLHYPFEEFSVQKIVQQMKQIALIVVKSALNIIDPQRKGCNFEIFRFNYLIDQKCKVYFLQVQKDPSLYLGCKVLSHIIPTMIDQTIQLVIDPLFPPLNHFPPNEYHRIGADIYKSFKFQCIFDEHQFEQ